MTDQTQTQDPQTQWTVQNQDTNKDFDMFGWDSDIFESENLIPIDWEWETNTDNSSDFDDDINVDYRNEWSFTNPVADTPQTQTTNSTNDLWDFDFSEVVNTDQTENTNKNTENDLWEFNFDTAWPTNTTPEAQSEDIWDDFWVYDEPDSPDEYVSPDDLDDDITDLDEDNINWDNDINEQNLWVNPNENINNTNPQDSDDNFLDLDKNEALEPIDEIDEDEIDENETEMPPMTPQEIQTANDEISTPETVTDDDETWNVEDTDLEEDLDEDDDLLYWDTDDLDEENWWDDTTSDIWNTWDLDNNPDNSTYKRNDDKTHIQNKFLELKFETEKIFQLVKKDYNVWFDILWANDDRQKIMYKLFAQENAIDIQKNILDKSDNSQISHILRFESDDTTVKIYIDNELLYNEITDLQNDDNKSKQVIEKLNKFIFLISEEYKKINKDKKAKEHENIKKATFREF